MFGFSASAKFLSLSLSHTADCCRREQDTLSFGDANGNKCTCQNRHVYHLFSTLTVIDDDVDLVSWRNVLLCWCSNIKKCIDEDFFLRHLKQVPYTV